MWQNTLTYTVGGKIYHKQEKLSKLQGCPAIGAVGWVFIGLAAFVVAMSIGALVGYDLGRKKAVQVAAINTIQQDSGNVGGLAAAGNGGGVTADLQTPILQPIQAAGALNESIDGAE